MSSIIIYSHEIAIVLVEPNGQQQNGNGTATRFKNLFKMHTQTHAIQFQPVLVVVVFFFFVSQSTIQIRGSKLLTKAEWKQKKKRRIKRKKRNRGNNLCDRSMRYRHNKRFKWRLYILLCFEFRIETEHKSAYVLC